ncbi:MAG: hypothetical protein JXR77_05425 [Lentisphaeria bacterium]|nr:hypothetical protein [Lentisphaeria bacterium]
MPVCYGYGEWGALIPERPPLLMVDRLALQGDGVAVGVKAVSMDEAVFQGHFPGGPILPGVLQVAAMEQVAGALVRSIAGTEVLPWLRALRRVKFRRPVTPGDLLLVKARIQESVGGTWTLEATAQVGTETASSGTLVLEQRRREELLPPPEPVPAPLPEGLAGTAADTIRILGMIPHRFPFQFVDRLAVLEATRAVGIKAVTGGEPWFAGVSLPLFPGCLLVEASAQTACARALTVPENAGKIGYFMSIDEMVFAGAVRPGDVLVMDVDVQQRGRFGMASAVLAVAGAEVARGTMKFAIVDPP